MFRQGNGRRVRRVLAYLRRRERARPHRRRELDLRHFARLFRRQAVLYTDTADFTARTARDGILHFLMVFNRMAERARPLLRRHRGRLLKVEADSLLVRFPDPDAACRGVMALEGLLLRLNRGRPRNERLRFSYGIGYGDLVDVEGDLFGLEMNLASKLGEDLARPGEILLTQAAATALGPAFRRRVVPHRTVKWGPTVVPTRRLRRERR